MLTELSYRFPSAARASRFLAELQSGAIGPCQCKRHRDDREILVRYELSRETTDFVSIAHQLDELAESLEGSESTT